MSWMTVKMLRDGWDEKEVGACLLKLHNSRRLSIPKEDYLTLGKYPIIDQSANNIAGWTNDALAIHHDPLPVIVFGDHTRIFKYIDFPFSVGADGTKILYANENIIDAKFFYFALNNLNLPNKGYNRHYKYLRKSIISFPKDRSEQRAIARALRAVQGAREARMREISLERERKAALMEHLFTHGTRGEATKQTEIGEMPESWKIVRFEEITTSGTQNGIYKSQIAAAHPAASCGACKAPPHGQLKSMSFNWVKHSCSSLVPCLLIYSSTISDVTPSPTVPIYPPSLQK